MGGEHRCTHNKQHTRPERAKSRSIGQRPMNSRGSYDGNGRMFFVGDVFDGRCSMGGAHRYEILPIQGGGEG